MAQAPWESDEQPSVLLGDLEFIPLMTTQSQAVLSSYMPTTSYSHAYLDVQRGNCLWTVLDMSEAVWVLMSVPDNICMDLHSCWWWRPWCWFALPSKMSAGQQFWRIFFCFSIGYMKEEQILETSLLGRDLQCVQVPHSICRAE